MSDWKCTKDRFLEDVKAHELEVIKDEGLYRHIRLQKPGTHAMQYDLVTWPGHLAYTGDMGDYTFARLADMFEFFRSDRGLQVNPDYWSEKLLAVDRNGGVDVYDPEVFRHRICERRMEWIREAKRERILNREQRRELWEEIAELLTVADDGEVRARDAASDFEIKIGGQRYDFADFWEVNLTSHSGRYIWACYAIVWGIAKYDASRRAVEELPAIAEKDAA